MLKKARDLGGQRSRAVNGLGTGVLMAGKIRGKMDSFYESGLSLGLWAQRG